jgi:hypothetical protein
MIARGPLLLLPVALLAACSPKRVDLDASNPAHCIAAFNVIATLVGRDGNASARRIAVARGAYEASRLPDDDASRSSAKAEALRVTKGRLAEDLDAAESLTGQCMKREESEVEFAARFPAIFAGTQD